jgi:Xaa-Pro dipeptidase
MLSQAIREWLPHLKPGMQEIVASALLEEKLRMKGHPGYTRSTLGFELTFGYLISGCEGLYATPFILVKGKRSRGFPGGASFKEIKEGEPILFDFSGFSRVIMLTNPGWQALEK